MFKVLLLTAALATPAVHAASDSARYWKAIVGLCTEYSPATHPPCNKANGADLILDEVARNCQGDKACLKRAVQICKQFSPATHPPCHPDNGLAMVLDEIKRVAQFYR